jgi:hypothetical protein
MLQHWQQHRSGVDPPHKRSVAGVALHPPR